VNTTIQPELFTEPPGARGAQDRVPHVDVFLRTPNTTLARGQAQPCSAPPSSARSVAISVTTAPT
jgi:hypothetical protein